MNVSQPQNVTPNLDSDSGSEPTPMSRRRFLAKGAAFAKAAAVTGPGLTILSGCDRIGGGQPLSFWNFYSPGGIVEGQDQWFQDTVAAWNEQHDTQVELEYFPSAEYIDGAVVQTAFAGGEGPDIFLISPGDFLRYYNGGVLEDLTPFLEQEAIDDYAEGSLDTRMVDGRIYGLPMELEPMAMYYSVQAWEEAGLSEADIPETWEQLLDLAEQLNEPGRFGLLFAPNPGYYQNFTWYPFMWQGGGEAVADDGASSNFDQPGAVQALELWRESVEMGVAPTEALGNGGGDAPANLAADYCAIQNVGPWAVAQLEEEEPDFEYGVFKLPVPEGGEYVTVLGGWAFVANSQGNNPEEAARFCAWALGSMEDHAIERGVEWNTVVKTNVPPRQSVQERAADEGAFDEGPMEFFLNEAFPGGRGEPRYPPEVYRAVSDAIQACQLDGADPQEQAERGAERINEFLEGYDGAPIF